MNYNYLISLLVIIPIFIFGYLLLTSDSFINNGQPEIEKIGEKIYVSNLSKEKCFEEWGGSWHVPKRECHTTTSNHLLAQLGDDIYLDSNDMIRQQFIDEGYIIFNSTDPQTEKGFVLDICDEFVITQMELYCLEKQN